MFNVQFCGGIGMYEMCLLTQNIASFVVIGLLLCVRRSSIVSYMFQNVTNIGC